MKILLLCCVLLILGGIQFTESKRGGGSRGGGRSKVSGEEKYAFLYGVLLDNIKNGVISSYQN